MKVLSKCYMALIFLLLYAPILVLVIFSFNESGSLSTFSGFSFKWYRELFRDTEALSALKNSLILFAPRLWRRLSERWGLSVLIGCAERA